MKVGLLGLLFCIFLTLKLTNHIAWSWWWVTAPLWGGFAVFAATLIGAVILAGLVAVVSHIRERLP